MSARPTPYFMATHIATRSTYVIEHARAKSWKLRASVMPAIGRVLDVRTPWASVPLELRRAARFYLNDSATLGRRNG